MVRWLVCLLALAAATGVEVRLDLPDPLVPGATLEAEIQINDPPGDVRRVDLPPVPGFTWRLTQRTSSQIVIRNGQRSQVLSIGLLVRADAEGDLELPAITITLADGGTLATAPRTVQVRPGDATLTGDAVATARFDPARIVPGQPCQLIYRLSVRTGEVSSLGIGPPDTAISLGERRIEQGRTLDAQGRPWTVITVTWPITFAAPGSHSVSGQQELVVGNLFNQRRRQVAVPPATLEVEALPAEGRPADYHGLIGPLEAVANLDRERVSTGEGAILTITVRGRQTDLARRPPLQLDGAQVYAKDESTGAEGHVFRWDVVPTRPGTIAIPALSFAYFDPGSRSYRRAATASVALEVLPGRQRDLGIVGTMPTVSANPAEPTPVRATLPPPLRGSGASVPPPWLVLAAFPAGLVMAGLAAVCVRLSRQRQPHRGRALRRAGRDPNALATALATLRPALTTPAQRQAAADFAAALDRQRFGGEPLPDPEAWLRILEGVA